ncbi:MAG: hypothetical protein U0360_01860 [Dehalococcoidia bacterium]
MLDRIAERGPGARELRFLRGLPSGLAIAEIELDEALPSFAERVEEAAASTIAAMRRGDDVIYQAAFFDGRRRGFADFPRSSAPSALGSWSYEVWDTKLARQRAKASAVLQLAFCLPDLVAGLQDACPNTCTALAAPRRDGEPSLRRLRCVLPGWLRASTRLCSTVFVLVSALHLPEPVEHCEVRSMGCGLCLVQRRAADDLASLIAGITARQRKALRAREIGTRAPRRVESAAGPASGRDTRCEPARVREQARIQVEGDAGRACDPRAATCAARPRWRAAGRRRSPDAA